MLLTYFPCNKILDQPCPFGCPVSITFPEHQQQTDGVFLSLLEREMRRESVCVSAGSHTNGYRNQVKVWQPKMPCCSQTWVKQRRPPAPDISVTQTIPICIVDSPTVPLVLTPLSALHTCGRRTVLEAAPGALSLFLGVLAVGLFISLPGSTSLLAGGS